MTVFVHQRNTHVGVGIIHLPTKKRTLGGGALYPDREATWS